MNAPVNVLNIGTLHRKELAHVCMGMSSPEILDGHDGADSAIDYVRVHDLDPQVTLHDFRQAVNERVHHFLSAEAYIFVQTLLKEMVHASQTAPTMYESNANVQELIKILTHIQRLPISGEFEVDFRLPSEANRSVGLGVSGRLGKHAQLTVTLFVDDDRAHVKVIAKSISFLEYEPQAMGLFESTVLAHFPSLGSLLLGQHKQKQRWNNREEVMYQKTVEFKDGWEKIQEYIDGAVQLFAG